MNEAKKLMKTLEKLMTVKEEKAIEENLPETKVKEDKVKDEK